MVPAEQVQGKVPDPRIHIVDWQACGLKLLAAAGKTGPGSASLPALYRQHSRDKGTSFLVHLYAVILVESGFNKMARSESDAYGLMQMTRVAAQAATLACGLQPLTRVTQLYDSATNVRFGSCYLDMLLMKNDQDWDRTLVEYNGGNRQLDSYNQGRPIADETAQYVLAVNRAVHSCQVDRQ